MWKESAIDIYIGGEMIKYGDDVKPEWIKLIVAT